jgi:hypothetical protein
MKIVGRILISLAGAVALVAGAVAGCSTTNNLNSGGGTSALGETCTRTFDCKSPLVCEQNVCLMPAATTAPDGGVLPTMDSGTVPGPHLGLLNESCQTSADCQSPFECMNQQCSIVNYGLTATGKSCGGECNTAADCCELPVNGTNLPALSYWEADTDGGQFVVHEAPSTFGIRCEDVLGYIGGDATICAGAANFANYQPGLAQGCFLYNTYCGSCGAGGPWACTNNQCVYTAPCTAQGTTLQLTVPEMVTACPSATRSGRSLTPATCNVPVGATNGTCAAGCSMAQDCAGKTPAQSNNHVCSPADGGTGTNCICYQAACYFPCKGDLDCAAGSSCDATTHLCKSTGCTADSDCVLSTSNANAKCISSACEIQCTKDTDCSPPSTICSAGYCKNSGCSTDVDCSSGGAHSFCVTSTPTTYTGAVTN